MSTRTAGVDLDSTLEPARLLALGGVAVLSLSYLVVFHRITAIAGNPETQLLAAAAAVLAATVLAPVLTVRRAFALSVLGLVGGAAVYYSTLHIEQPLLPVVVHIVGDSLQLLTGESLLGIVNADVWAIAGTPAPAFFTWYLAMRRRYVGAVLVGGATLSVFVLTGDAAALPTLFGVLGGAAAVGFGDADRRGGTTGSDVVAVVIAAMVVVTVTVSLVPGGGGATPVSFGSGAGTGPAADTVEGSLVSADSSMTVQGSLDLSPKVRFSVESGQAGYWRVGSYDRYTGEGWVRTGGTREFDGAAGPPGRSRTVVQTVEAAQRLDVMPAAWKPTGVRGAPTQVRETAEGGLVPAGAIREGDTYVVTSEVPVAGPQVLREAGTDYPEDVERRYTQLPTTVPDRVARRTARITANADNPYETARVVEQWLENNRRYSLNVNRPDGHIADAFLFEMNRGYCTYFATTMAVMLRSQGIPARMVVGYTPGERVGRDEWVVRGLNSHAWVEVYFPDVGWVRFDPTPGGPRQATESDTLRRARSQNVSGVDTQQTGPDPWTPTPDPSTPVGPSSPPIRQGTPNIPGGFGNDSTPPGGFGGFQASPTPPGGADWPSLPDLPSREQVALGAIVLAGALAGARRAGFTDRAYRAVWLRYQPRGDPATDVDRAYRRVEYVLGRRERPRRPGETARQYVRAVGDERARRVADLYERARYAGRADEESADEAVDLADDVVSDGSWLRRG